MYFGQGLVPRIMSHRPVLYFKNGKDFEMGGTMGTVSYLQILAPELTDKMLAEFLEMDSNLMVNFHIQSIDQMKAIKLVKKQGDGY